MVELADITNWVELENLNEQHKSKKLYNKKLNMVIVLNGLGATLSKNAMPLIQYRGKNCLAEAINDAKNILKK